MRKPLLVVIAGPTAIGKTDLSISLANQWETSIISADSRQFYQEMELGTAKPTKEERAAAPHYMVNNLSIHQEYTVADYEKEVIALLDELFKENEILILTGGSGLFIKAILEGFDPIPAIDPSIRELLNQRLANNELNQMVQEIQSIDPVWASTADLKNPRRVIRALEVFQGTDKPLSYWHSLPPIERQFDSLFYVLERSREELFERIDRRMDIMIKQGLFEEAVKLYPHKNLKSLQTVGYQEIFGYLDGEYNRKTAIELLKRNSRRYAKRQITWFKKQKNTRFVSVNETQIILEEIRTRAYLRD